MKVAESSLDGWKTLWVKEELLVTSNFSFSHRVFKRLIQQTRKKQDLFGKGKIKEPDGETNKIKKTTLENETMLVTSIFPSGSFRWCFQAIFSPSNHKKHFFFIWIY